MRKPGSGRLKSWCLVVWLLTGSASVFAQLPAMGECPQPRFTGKAPEDMYGLANPLSATAERIAAGKRSYDKDASPPCQVCHGINGDGKGRMATQFDPRPRNFRCAQTVNGIPDGQLFWIIRNGSPGTSMPAFKPLSDEQIWQVVLYLRDLAQPRR